MREKEREKDAGLKGVEKDNWKRWLKALIWIYYTIKGSWHSYGLYICAFCAEHRMGGHNFNPIRPHSEKFTSAEWCHNKVNDCRSYCALQQSLDQFCFRTRILHLNVKWWLNTVPQLFTMQKSNLAIYICCQELLSSTCSLLDWRVIISGTWQLIIIHNPHNPCLASFQVFRVMLFYTLLMFFFTMKVCHMSFN